MKLKHNFASTLQLIDFRENSIVLNQYDQSDRLLFIFLLIYEWEKNYKSKNNNALLSKRQLISLLFDIKPESEVFPFADPSSITRCALDHLFQRELLIKQDNHFALPDGFPNGVNEYVSWPVRPLFGMVGIKVAPTPLPIKKILSDFATLLLTKPTAVRAYQYQELPNLDGKGKGADPAVLFFKRHSLVLKDFHSYTSDRELFFISLMLEYQLMFPNLKLPSIKDLVDLCQAVVGVKLDRSIVQRMVGNITKLNLTETIQKKIKFKLEQCKTATSIAWNLQPLAANSKTKLVLDYDLATSITKLQESFEQRWVKNLKEEALPPENMKESKEEVDSTIMTEQCAYPFMIELDNAEIVKNSTIFPSTEKQSTMELDDTTEQGASNTKRSMELEDALVPRNKKHKKNDSLLEGEVAENIDVSENVPETTEYVDYEAVAAKLPEFGSGNRENELNYGGTLINDPFSEEFTCDKSVVNFQDKRKSSLYWPAYQRFGFLSGKGKSEITIPFAKLKKIDINVELKNISTKRSPKSQEYFSKVAQALELKETHELSFEQTIKTIRKEVIDPLKKEKITPYSYETILAPIVQGQFQENAKSIIVLLKDAYAICLGLKEQELNFAGVHEKNAIKIAMQLEIAIDYFCEIVRTSLEIVKSINRLAEQSNLSASLKTREGVDIVTELRNSDHETSEGYGKSLLLETSFRGVNAARIHNAVAAQDICEKLTLDELENYIKNLFNEYNRLFSEDNSLQTAPIKPEQKENKGSMLSNDADFDELTVSEHQDRIREKWSSEMDKMKSNDKAEVMEEEDLNLISKLTTINSR